MAEQTGDAVLADSPLGRGREDARSTHMKLRVTNRPDGRQRTVFSARDPRFDLRPILAQGQENNG